MSRAQRIGNLIAVTLPFAAFVAAIPLLWHHAVGARELVMLVVLYALTCLGVTVGYHRLLTHRAFKTFAPVKVILAVLGSIAVEGRVITWVADHRKHHAFADEEGDPHSPHGHGSGLKGALKGLAHAHIGWMFTGHGRAEVERYAPDLLRDRGIRFVDRTFFLWVALGLALPAGIGWLADGLTGAALGLLWGGLVRIFLLHHVTWSVNSICHFFGRRRFATDDESRNVFWLALPSLGEAWHHNHHAFPTSAFHGLKPWEIDVSGLVIRGLERVGLAWDVVRVSAERQQSKLADAAGAAQSRGANPAPAAPS